MKNYFNRMAIGALSTVALGFAIAMWPGTGLGRDNAEPPDPWARYQIILDRNIFSRQRGPIRRPEDDEEPREIVMPNPESYLLLRGVVQEDGTFMAFVEDTRSAEILRLHKGDSVARGVIAALNLDVLEYEWEGRKIAVRMGYDLEGGHGAVTANELMEWSQTSATTGSEAAATEEPAAPTGDEAEILKRLMEQRKQQLGQ